MFERIVDRSVNPYVLVTADGTIAWVSHSAAELLGHDPEEAVGWNVLDLLDEPSREVAARSLVDIVEHGGDDFATRWMGAGAVFDVRTAGGDLLPCEAALAAPARVGGEHFVIQLRRASVQTATRAALKAMGDGEPLDRVLRLVAGVVEQSIAGVTVEIGLRDGPRLPMQFHAPGRGIASEARGAGWEGPWIDAAASGAFLALDLDDLPDAVHDHAARAGSVGGWFQPVRLEGGEPGEAVLAVWHTAMTPLTALINQTLERAAELATVALQWHAGRRALRHAAEHDALTGLANRRGLMSRLGGESVAAGSAVLYVDLDDFKAVNDDFGHLVGDSVLEVVAERLRRTVRPSDLLARVGGDEFVVVCPEGNSAARDHVLAHRIIDAIAEPITPDRGDRQLVVTIGASVGVSVADGATDLVDLLVRADDGLRAAKRRGKGCAAVAL